MGDMWVEVPLGSAQRGGGLVPGPEAAFFTEGRVWQAASGVAGPEVGQVMATEPAILSMLASILNMEGGSRTNLRCN